MSLISGLTIFDGCLSTRILKQILFSSQEEVAHIDRLAEKIGAMQVLKSSFHPILNIILLALDAPPVFMRTKAIRALGQIVMSDLNILSTVRFDVHRLEPTIYVYTCPSLTFVARLKVICSTVLLLFVMPQ
jgi:hypothetical protein